MAKRVFKDENGVTMPVKTERAPAENLPTAAEQRPREDSFEQERTGADSGDNSRNREERRKKPIGEEEIAKAKSLMKEYFNDKRLFDERFSENFDTYNLLYNENNGAPQYEKDSDGELRKRLIKRRIGGQTLNVILNKHADAMDNYPEPLFLPRSADDEETAQALSSVVPCVLDRSRYQRTYSDCWTDKLVGGACCVCVVWDGSAENGLGDIAIKRVNMLNIAWAPYVEDIQDSPNFFCVAYDDIERIKEAYPKLKEVSVEDLGLSEFKTYDAESETKNKAALVDWYYKKDGLVHLCKFVGNQIIFASENEPEDYPNGFYEHGKYPFVVGALFPLRKTPVGFSFIDICRAPQENLDNVKSDILKNIKVNSQTRNLVSRSAMVNVNDLSDINKEFVEADGLDLSRIMYPIETKDIAPGALSMYQALVEEIKTTTGTNDASNGASAAGVTSGSAIAALQEAGGKISRDVNKGGFREFEEICIMIVELMRQFYKTERWFRVIGEDKKPEYMQFSNEGLMPQTVTVDEVDEPFERLPVFDIVVKAQRSNPFTTAANNQMMIDMFNMGAFAPENADAALVMLECMSFEGKDKVVEMIKQNSQTMQAMQQMAGQLQMSDAMLAEQAAQSVPATPTQI